MVRAVNSFLLYRLKIADIIFVLENFQPYISLSICMLYICIHDIYIVVFDVDV